MPTLAKRVLRELTSPDRLDSSSPSFGSTHLASTAAVTVAIVRRASELEGVRFRDQRIVIRGAGARGIAAAHALKRALQDSGLTWREACGRVFVVDSDGLVVEGPTVPLKLRRHASAAFRLDGWSFDGARPSLLETVRNTGAGVLVGLSGEAGAFTREVVDAVAANAPRPVILPLSWPVGRREAEVSDVMAWTDGRALCVGPAAGPEDAGCIEGWALPGVALATVIADAPEFDDDMVLAAARALLEWASQRPDRLVPGLGELGDVTQSVAVAVVRAALRSGAANNPELTFSGLEPYVAARIDGDQRLPDPRDDGGWDGGTID